MSPYRHILIAICALLCGDGALFGADPKKALAAPVTEYEAKAAFVYKLPAFVVWPEATLPADNTLVLGVVGQHPQVEHFLRMNGDRVSLKGEEQPRRLIVRHSIDGHDLDGIHMLYLCDSAKRHIPDILKKATTFNILTIGESPGFLDKGGMIEFFVNKQNRIRFTIRNKTAQKKRFRLDSQLLKISEERR